MIKIALTGNIGSGKTTVAKIFETINIPVFYSDDIAKELYSDKDVRDAVLSLFSKNILTKDKIDFKKLAMIAFNSQENLNLLTSIIHPVVLNKFSEWQKQHSKHKYVVLESAILFESGFYKHSDKIITVTAPESIRIERIKKRDGVSTEKALQRAKYQWEEEKKIKLSHFVIVNDDETAVLPQVLKIHETLMAE